MTRHHGLSILHGQRRRLLCVIIPRYGFALRRTAADGIGWSKSRHGGGVQAPGDAFALRCSRRQAKAGRRIDAPLSVRRTRCVGCGLLSPHVVAHFLGPLVERSSSARAAFRRSPAGVFRGRQASHGQGSSILGGSRSGFGLRGFAASASRSREERDRRGARIARHRGRARSRFSGCGVCCAPSGES